MIHRQPQAAQAAAHPMGESGPRLGVHMSVAGGLPRAIDRAVATGCDAIQIFTTASNRWKPRPLSDSEVQQFRDQARRADVRPIMAHASYLINLAAPDATLRRRSIEALIEELRRAEALGLIGVVLHPGAYTTSSEEAGLSRIAEGIGDAFAAHDSGSAQLLLEHTAGQGTVLGHRFEHLATTIAALDGSARLGVCLDTCHLVAAGYDIITPAGYAAVFEEFDRIVGLDRLKAFHLNDSRKPLGSRLDRHEHIGDGYIGTEPFRRLLQDDRFRDLPMVLETAKRGSTPAAVIEADPMDCRNLAILRRLR